MENRVRGNEYRTTIVCIDSYENSAPMGRFYNPYDPQGESFCGLTRLLVRMTDLLDAMDFPQSFTVARSFVRAPMNPERPPEEAVQEGKLATFSLSILFRQNATWQGTVAWLEGGKSQSFRSVLELVFLMDSALRGSISGEWAKN